MASLEDFENLDFSEFESFKTPTEKETDFSDILERSRIEGSTADISEHPRSEDFPDQTDFSKITFGKNFETESEETDFESSSDESFEDDETEKSFEEESSSESSEDSVESEGSIKSNEESEAYKDDLSSEESEDSSLTESIENSLDSKVTHSVSC